MIRLKHFLLRLALLDNGSLDSLPELIEGVLRLEARAQRLVYLLEDSALFGSLILTLLGEVNRLGFCDGRTSLILLSFSIVSRAALQRPIQVLRLFVSKICSNNTELGERQHLLGNLVSVEHTLRFLSICLKRTEKA